MRSNAAAYSSALDLFSIGIGPSSSHTVGPMRAAAEFVDELLTFTPDSSIASLTCTLFGSLASTGIGHGTPAAVIAGLRGMHPETCDPVEVRNSWARLYSEPTLLKLADGRSVSLSQASIIFEPRKRHPLHPNAMLFRAECGGAVLERLTLSIGGGFIIRPDQPQESGPTLPFPYRTASELLATCERESLAIWQVALANEDALRPRKETERGLDAIWRAMRECVEAGLDEHGELPGGLRVHRRASAIREQLIANPDTTDDEAWISVYALAVNEENAAGGRVVTAPTNGAAGIIPATFLDHLRRQGALGDETDLVRRMLLTATAVGSVIKRSASISGAEVGCQGEVGSACAMAAAGLAAAQGANPRQCENAAEIALEHHLGLTCDPIGGLVQIPCIERNAVAAVTARTAARLAKLHDGSHRISLDTAIDAMRLTGADMHSKYKETSEGGLAVAFVEC